MGSDLLASAAMSNAPPSNAPPSIVEAIERVRETLAADPRVASALLFGSAARNRARADSDLDVALLAADGAQVRALRRDLLRLGARASLAAGRDVQLLLLDDAPPVLGRQVFAYGRVLFDRDPQRLASTLERILIAYFDGAYHRGIMEQALRARLAARG